MFTIDGAGNGDPAPIITTVSAAESVHNGRVIAFETIAAKPGPHATKAPGRQGQPEPSPLG